MVNDGFMGDVFDNPDEMDFQDIIESKTNHRIHLLISGHSESVDTLQKITEKSESLFEHVYPDKVGDFYRLELFIESSDYAGFVQSTYFNKVTKDLSEIINYCVKLFGKINIALVYKNLQGQVKYRYKKRVSNERDNEKLTEELREFYTKTPDDCNWNFESKTPNLYLQPGVENISAELADVDETKSKLSEVHKKIEENKSFFEMQFNIEDKTFHLYHHPGRAFPLPVLLKSADDMPKPEDYWGFDNWFWEEGADNQRIDSQDIDGIDFDKDEYYKELYNKEKGNDVKHKIPEVYKQNVDELKDWPLLGYYSHEYECGCFGPHIVLCPENIKDEAERQGVNVELVYLIVHVHELAHAMMDDMDKNRAEGSLQSLFARAMEESLANRITLEWFENYDKGNLNKVIKYIKTQPTIYKFGIKQYRANVDWKKWAESYKNMHYLLKVWFDACFFKNVKTDTVLKEYNKVFEFNLDELIELFKKVAVNKLEENSIESYCNSIKKFDTLNNHMTCDWFAKTIMGKFTDDYDPLSFLEKKTKDTFNKSSLKLTTKQSHISRCKKFAQCILGFYYANIWLLVDKDDSLFCELVAKNALFASKEVVEDVKNGRLGTEDNIGKKNKYASWDHMMRVRNTDRSFKNKHFPDKNPKTSHLGRTVIGDNNTMANLAIKNAIIESYKRKHKVIIQDISLFKDYEACHIWDYPRDRRYYASIANLILLPRALAKLTDHNVAVKELLRYEVFIRFGFKPDGHADPKKPKNYKKYIWRDHDVL